MYVFVDLFDNPLTRSKMKILRLNPSLKNPGQPSTCKLHIKYIFPNK